MKLTLKNLGFCKMGSHYVLLYIAVYRLLYGLFLLQFDNTNEVMQNTIQTCRQSSIVFEKPGILSENLKTLTSSNYSAVQYFLLKLRTRFLLIAV